MYPYSKIDVSEAELEDLVRQYPHLIEEGLRYVDHQNHTIGGRLDVLLADSGNAFVVAELKVVQDDGMLAQSLDYYDYVSSNVETYARLYQTHKIDPTQPVRLLLLAPSFSPTLLNRCRWLDIPISVFSFQCIRVDGDGKTLPIFDDHQVPSRPTLVELTSSSDHFNYITDEEVRATASSFLKEVLSWDSAQITVDSTKYALSLKVCGRVFAYLSTRRKHFIIGTYSPEDEWSDYPVKAEVDLGHVKDVMKLAMERRRK